MHQVLFEAIAMLKQDLRYSIPKKVQDTYKNLSVNTSSQLLTTNAFI